jgi:hypothetical protein
MMRRRLLILSGMAAMVLVLAGCLGGSELAVLTVRFQGMDPNIGQRFEVRLFKQGSPSEIGRSVLDTITNGSFDMEFTGVEEGTTYVLEFFADKNGSGSYDPPPADDAWRLVVPMTSIAVTATFTRSGTTTDIGWGTGQSNVPAVDGVIEDDEYAHFFEDAGIGMRVYWRNDQTTLTMGLVSPGTGWVSVGFDATNVKQDADIILAAVVGNQLVIEDHFGTGPYSHALDAEQNILESAGIESGGQTVVEFSIPLNSGDSWDKPLVPGNTYPLLLGYHRTSDDMSRKHSEGSTTQFTLDP